MSDVQLLSWSESCDGSVSLQSSGGFTIKMRHGIDKTWHVITYEHLQKILRLAKSQGNRVPQRAFLLLSRLVPVEQAFLRGL